MRFRSALAVGVAWALLVACGPESEPRRKSHGTPDAAAGASGDAAVDAPQVEKVLRVATFNVRLLFDTNCDSGNCDTGDFEKVLSQAALAARAEGIASAIRSLDADVVALQEIETQASFEALTSRLTDLYPTAILGETGAPGSVDVAVLGAGSLLEVRKHRHKSLAKPDGTLTSFAREFLEVHLELDGRRVIAFSAHFRSKASDDPGRRLAEAQAAHEIVVASAKEFPDSIVVLAGDLNDTPGSAPLEALESDAQLLRVASDKSPEEQGTYWWNGQVEAIDHVFLAASSIGRYVPASATVVNATSGWGLADSDHAALMADFGVR